MGGAAADLQETTSLREALRRLWADHVVWTRQYIVAALAGSPDAEAAAGRLLRNQEDLGAAVVPFYGEEAGAELTRLLKDHILIAVDAVAAAIDDDEARFRRHDRRWTANADEIAAFLSGANPTNWPEGDLKDLLALHLKLTKHELLARFEEQWETDIARFDDIFTEILTLSDALSDGLIAQFPDLFDGEAAGTPRASLRAALRRLWADHSIWTRNYIVAAVAGAPDAKATASRLLRNQEDIGAAIVPLYGEDAGAELTRLLKDHILIAVDLVGAAIKGNQRAFARHDKRWDANADEIAAFLAGANPNWPEADVRDLLGQHLALTKGEAVARLTQDWGADVAAFDDIFTEILTVSDALADGIVAQFPERFTAERGGLAASVQAAAANGAGHRNGNGAGSERAKASLGSGLRRLWADHAIWTRQYIIAAVGGTPDAEAAAGRLLRNQEDIGAAVVPFYGDAAAERLTELLKEHVMIAVDLVAAAVKGDQRGFARHDKRWDANADEIAAFLAGANPNWPEADVRDLLGQHLALTKGEAVARLTQDWGADVAAFDDIFTEILTISDALADGIVAQFPDRFAAAAASAGGGAPGHKTRFHSSLGG